MPNPRRKGTVWQRVRKRVLQANPNCVRCGQPADTVDHITPISLGGDPLDETNLRSMCKSCNSSRGNGTRTRMVTSRDW